jgi:hypothetical protein
MNRNTIFALMALEMAIIAEIMNNLTFVVVNDDETDTPNLDDYDDYDDYDFPHTEQETFLDRAVVDEGTFGERELVDWLTNDCGLNVNKSASDYAPNEKMIALSVSEMAQIKREMDILRVRANEGEELARKVRSLHDEFFPQA